MVSLVTCHYRKCVSSATVSRRLILITWGFAWPSINGSHRFGLESQFLQAPSGIVSKEVPGALSD